MFLFLYSDHMVAVKNSPKVPEHRPGPPDGARARNRKRRVEALLGAAEELFLEFGVAGVPVERIASAAGTSKGNFYRYFDDMEQLVATLFAPLADGIETAFRAAEAALSDASDPTSTYRRLGTALAGVLLAHPGRVRLYLQEARGPAVGARRPVRALADRIGARAIDLTRIAQRRGMLVDVDPRVSALAVVGAVERLLFATLTDEHPLDPATAVDDLVRIVLDGMRPPPRPM